MSRYAVGAGKLGLSTRCSSPNGLKQHLRAIHLAIAETRRKGFGWLS